MNYREAVLNAYRTYPQGEMQDLVKLTCQLTLGPGHLIHNPSAAVAEVLREAAEGRAAQTDNRIVSPPSQTLELVGEGYYRAHLALQGGISAESIACMFLYTAAVTSQTEKTALLWERGEQLLELCADGTLPREWDGFVRKWLEADCPLQHHSAAFRAVYHPAYRVVSEASVGLLPLLTRLEMLLQEADEEHPLLLSLDGCCASGKSSLSAALNAVYGGTVIHMDDFFLRPEQRTPERLAEPGGNVDYERFASEVLAPLKAGHGFSYRVFDCGRRALGRSVTVTPSHFYCIEGSYSQHPYFGNPYTLRAFLRCSPEEQLRRILRRNGKARVEMFRNRWIPLEERYFEAFRTQEEADYMLIT